MKKRIPYSFLMVSVLGLLPVSAQEAADGEYVTDGVPAYWEGEEDAAMPEVPALFRDDALLDESHANRELGVNVYTAPSIAGIFAQLEDLPPVPEAYVLRQHPERLSTAPGKVALEMGFLLADGFIAVCSNHLNDVKAIALELNRYGEALGVGDIMDEHSAALLEQAEKGNLREFKRILTATQGDVNRELADLGDPDMAHLIALGGWVRACEAEAAALAEDFSASKAAIIFYADAPAYFREILHGTDPALAKHLQIEAMCGLLEKLAGLMSLPEGEEATKAKVEQIRAAAAELADLIVGREYAR